MSHQLHAAPQTAVKARPAAQPAAKARPAAQPAARTAVQRPAARPTGPVIRRAVINKKNYLLLADVARFYGLTLTADKSTWTAASKTTRIVLTKDSRTAKLNGVTIYLAFAPTEQAGQPFVSQADFQTYIDPLLRPLTLPRRRINRIVIDPGHGGKDPGCRSAFTIEKNINLLIAKLLAQTLQARGYTVALTHQRDIFVPLPQRISLAQGFKPDLFISLHCNSAEDTSARGIEVFCATPAGTPPVGSHVISPRPCAANAFDLQNVTVAYHAQKQLTSLLMMPDRGVRHCRYLVITDMTAPCLLVEMGYISNPVDRFFLNTPFKQQLIAHGLANAIDAFRQASAPLPPVIRR